jgi:hypothetical protein
MKKTILSLLLAVGLIRGGSASVLSDVQYLINPISNQGTALMGISGNNIVGTYWDDNFSMHGLIYDGVNWSTLDFPWSTDFPRVYGYNNSDTIIFGISGGNMVGQYRNYTGYFGFVFDGVNWTTLNHIKTYGYGGSTTSLTGISGNIVVGNYSINNGSSSGGGFIYDGVNWTTLISPLSSGWNGNRRTFLNDIDNGNIIGHSLDTNGSYYGFLYSNGNWTKLSIPDAIALYPYGISGNNIVGEYYDQNGNRHGFLYDGITWTTLDTPAGGTSILDIDGNNILGSDNNGNFIASLASLPEPSTYALFGIGAIGMLVVLRRKRLC